MFVGIVSKTPADVLAENPVAFSLFGISCTCLEGRGSFAKLTRYYSKVVAVMVFDEKA